MFNKSYHLHQTEHKTTFVDRHITEVRAPTDDSVKLLREMEDKIKESFLGTWDLKNNLFDAKIFAFRNYDFAYDEEIILDIRYKVNGDSFKCHAKCSERSSVEELIEKAQAALVESLAKYALKFSFDNLDVQSQMVINNRIFKRNS